MVRVLIVAMLILPGLLPAQSFPSDGKSPAEAKGAELLEAVCPGRVEVGEKIGCGTECPAFTGGNNGWIWALARVTRGHFLSPTSDDAVLSMVGCEVRSEDLGGTVLLTRRSQRWAMEWYKAGVETSQCHNVPLQDAREILICLGGDGDQLGHVSTALYVEDLLSPTRSGLDGPHFFELWDNTARCGEDPEVTRAFIEKVEFAGSSISVAASLGRSSSSDAQACLPPVKSYHLDFVFDGHTYQPTAASAETARMFGSR